MPVSLVFGASGAVGRFLCPRLLAAGHDVVAVSRSAHAAGDARQRWIVGDLHGTVQPLPAAAAVFGLGPLDAFAAWFDAARLDGAIRVVALGSMSIDSKRDSPDAGERDTARRLDAAERQLFAAAGRHGIGCTVLRPTLIYGAGIDRSLAPLVRFARRWRVFPRIPAACGLRQPVHADDLAAACLSVLAQPRCIGRTYALGGGERLGFDAMLERVRASLPWRCLPLPLPLAAAHLLARLGFAAPAAVARLTQDLVADDAAARADFGWSPRPFRFEGSALPAP